MRDSITADRIANSILLRRKQYNNFILVEGSQDRLFFLKFKQEASQIEITFGWEKLSEIITILKQRGFDKVVGIVDKDLRDIIADQPPLEDNIITTEEHDINILCIESTFSIIFHDYCSEEKLKAFKEEMQCDCIKSYTYRLARPISYLKILNKREDLHLSFKSNDAKKTRLDYFKFIDKNTYTFISLEKLVETIVNFSRNKTSKPILESNRIIKKLKAIMSEEQYEDSKLNSGHDFGSIICLGLRKALGSKELDSDAFLKEAILCYDSRDFIKTEMYSRIKELESRQKTAYLRV